MQIIYSTYVIFDYLFKSEININKFIINFLLRMEALSRLGIKA